MINKIMNIAKILQTSQNTKHYNTTLPILLQVLEKTKMGYLLKLGSNVIEAKSQNNLQIGGKYWAIMKDSPASDIVISNLIKQPKIFENINNSNLKLDINNIYDLLKDSKFIEKFSETLSERAINSTSKEEFIFITNSIIALNKKILNLVIKDGKKNMLLQIKKPKNNKIEFCAIFNNLGIISGSIYDTESLILKTQYKNVKKILENNIKNLEDFEKFKEISIIVNENIDIFFDMHDESMLDFEA